jgi:hypothetical protein
MKSDIDQNLMPLSIRRLDLEKDFPLFYEWLRHEYVSQENPAEFNYYSLLESYQSNEGATFAESCMVCSGDDPVMEVDLCKGEMHEISPFYDAKKDDYVLRLQLPPQRDEQLIERGMHLVLQYCATEKNARHLIVPVYKRDEFQKNLLIKLGFAPYSKDLYKDTFSIYVLKQK